MQCADETTASRSRSYSPLPEKGEGVRGRGLWLGADPSRPSATLPLTGEGIGDHCVNGRGWLWLLSLSGAGLGERAVAIYYGKTGSLRREEPDGENDGRDAEDQANDRGNQPLKLRHAEGREDTP